MVTLRKRTYQSFRSFLDAEETFSREEKEFILSLFQDPKIRTIFQVSTFLVLWSLCVAFIDASLFARGGIFVAFRHSLLSSFFPSLLFIFLNAIVKFFAIRYWTRAFHISLKHILVGVIPIAGSFFFSAYLLRKYPLLLEVMRRYFRFLRKKFRWFFLLFGRD